MQRLGGTFLDVLLSISLESLVLRTDCPVSRGGEGGSERRPELFQRISCERVYCSSGNDPGPARRRIITFLYFFPRFYAFYCCGLIFSLRPRAEMLFTPARAPIRALRYACNFHALVTAESNTPENSRRFACVKLGVHFRGELR